MFRFKISRGFGVSLSALFLTSSLSSCACEQEINKKFESKLAPNIPELPNIAELFLAGAGQFNKSYYNVQKESCEIGVYFSFLSTDRAKGWYNHNKNYSNKTLVEVILTKENIITPYSLSNPIQVAIVIQFNQEVDKENFLHYIQVPLIRLPFDDYETFRDAFYEANPETTFKSGDKLYFYWFDNGDLIITRNQKNPVTVNKKRIDKALLDAFLSYECSLSFDLIKSVNSIIPVLIPIF